MNTLHVDLAEALRLEERSLNASGIFQSLVYDGWLLGYRPGNTKRLRCVNPFYESTLPLAHKVEYCARFYRSAGLPAIFRLLPFSQPAELDAWLEHAGWERFERTQVLHTKLSAEISASSLDGVEVMSVPDWEEPAAPLLGIAAETIPLHVDRARAYPLSQAGALLRRDGEVVACGLVKIEDDHAGLFALHTAEAWRRQGLGRAIVSALLAEAWRRGARSTYLQVDADNAAAQALYRGFGFSTAYTYWYRARPGEQR
jgi:N-acetylglutamate synthase